MVVYRVENKTMFAQFTSTQPVADSLKRLIYQQAKRDPARRQQLLDAVGRLERASWVPWLFAQTLEQVAPGRVALVGNELIWAGDGDLLAEVERAIDDYLGAVAHG